MLYIEINLLNLHIQYTYLNRIMDQGGRKPHLQYVITCWIYELLFIKLHFLSFKWISFEFHSIKKKSKLQWCHLLTLILFKTCGWLENLSSMKHKRRHTVGRMTASVTTHFHWMEFNEMMQMQWKWKVTFLSGLKQHEPK